MTQINGSIVAIVTPMQEDGSLDFPALRALVDWHVAEGTDGIVIVGTTGESPTVNVDEHCELIRVAVEQADKRIPIIAGTGGNSTKEAIELTAFAKQVGADASLQVVPYYNKPPQEGIYQHFKAIAGKTNLPCIVYNIIGRTGVNMTDETTIRLSQIDNIIGTKEASGDMNQIARIIQGSAPDFKVWSGDDNQTFLIMSMGGYGVVSVVSHLVGNQIKHMIGLLLEGDIEGAASEHRRLLPIFLGMFVESNPIPVKYAVNHVGLKVGEPRLPLVPPSEKAVAQIEKLLDEFEIDLPVSA
mgnify:CR=1 FL=1